MRKVTFSATVTEAAEESFTGTLRTFTLEGSVEFPDKSNMYHVSDDEWFAFCRRAVSHRLYHYLYQNAQNQWVNFTRKQFDKCPIQAWIKEGEGPESDLTVESSAYSEESMEGDWLETTLYSDPTLSYLREKKGSHLIDAGNLNCFGVPGTLGGGVFLLAIATIFKPWSDSGDPITYAVLASVSVLAIVLGLALILIAKKHVRESKTLGELITSAESKFTQKSGFFKDKFQITFSSLAPSAE